MSHKQQIFLLTAVYMLLVSFSSFALAQDALPDAKFEFSFDKEDSRLNVESGEVELTQGGLAGKALKIGDPKNKIFWQILIRISIGKKVRFHFGSNLLIGKAPANLAIGCIPVPLRRMLQ